MTSVLPRDAAGHLLLRRLAHDTQRCHACPGDLTAVGVVPQRQAFARRSRPKEVEEKHVSGGQEERRTLRCSNLRPHGKCGRSTCFPLPKLECGVQPSPRSMTLLFIVSWLRGTRNVTSKITIRCRHVRLHKLNTTNTKTVPAPTRLLHSLQFPSPSHFRSR